MPHTLLNGGITILRCSEDAPRTGVREREFTSHQLTNNLAWQAVKVKFVIGKVVVQFEVNAVSELRASASRAALHSALH